jgi:hypothetical protein
MLSSTPHSVRPLIVPEPTLTLFGIFMCEPTDGDGKQFGDLEPAIAEYQGLETENFPLRFPQWWWDR